MSIALNISEILFAGFDISESKRKKMVNDQKYILLTWMIHWRI